MSENVHDIRTNRNLHENDGKQEKEAAARS